MLNYIPAPPIKDNALMPILRYSGHTELYPELKDPSIAKVSDECFYLFASIGSSITQQWKVGRFKAAQPTGPWEELTPVSFHNLWGPQLCAPAVRYEEKDGLGVWTMYIQTACFEENGQIALATSTDGENFYGAQPQLITKEMLGQQTQNVVGLYDAGISEVIFNQESYLCMIFSGYRRIGCGDLYMTYRAKKAPEDSWAPVQQLLTQEQVPFHNHPDDEAFEWGLEGAQITQIDTHGYLLSGVCFTPKPHGYTGTRQRVFFAYAISLLGPFVPLTTPFEPTEFQGKRGENGHPDALVVGNTLHVYYQERYGDNELWHFRNAQFDLPTLRQYFNQVITPTSHQPGVVPTPVVPPKSIRLRTSVQKSAYSTHAVA